MLFDLGNRCNLNVVELDEFVRRQTVDVGTEEKRDLLPSDCRVAVDSCGDKRFDIGSQDAPQEILTKNRRFCTHAAVSAGASAGSDAEMNLKVA